MKKCVFILALVVAACGLTACDSWDEFWGGKSASEPTDPPVMERILTGCRITTFGTGVPAWGQLCSLDTGAEAFVDEVTNLDGRTTPRTLSFPKGFFDQTPAKWQVWVVAKSPAHCGIDPIADCYDTWSGLATLDWYNDPSEGRYLVASFQMRRIPGGVGLAGR